jgi:hypothetical protein
VTISINPSNKKSADTLQVCTTEGGHAVQRAGGDVRFGGLAFDVPGVQPVAV